jgi:small GTP-binding protein
VGINFLTCTLAITDIAGGNEYKQLRDACIHLNEAFMLVYSISSRSSFTQIPQLYDEIRQARELRHGNGRSREPIIIIVGNKADMVERAVPRWEGEEIAETMGCKFMEVSAKDGTNVEDLFSAIAREVQIPCMENRLLEDLKESLPRWHELVDNMKGESLATRPLMVDEVTKKTDIKSILFLRYQQPSAIQSVCSTKYQHLLRNLSYCFGSRLLWASSKPKENSVNQEPPPGRTGVAATDYCQSQTLFKEALRFLSNFDRKVRDIERQRLIARYQLMIDVEDSWVGVRSYQQKDGAGMNKDDVLRGVRKSLASCWRTCDTASFEILKHGNARSSIQAMNDEFTRMVENLP